MKAKSNIWLPVFLMVALALTRFPGLLPQNFSAVYALMFCAGVFFPGRMAWWLPLVTIGITDVLLNLYYWLSLGIPAFQPDMLRYSLINYAVYPLLILLGRKMGPLAETLSKKFKGLAGAGISLTFLLGGGILGALAFYFITNTAAWFFNPFNNIEYTKTLEGWIRALTLGTNGWPHTWEFFRNTMMSGGLFTGLFAGAMKLSEASAEQEAEEPETDEEEAPEPQPEEGKA